MHYSVIVPFYNEEKNISRFNIELINNIKKITSEDRLFEIVYVDDGSVDKTFDEEHDSDVMKKLLKDFPKESRRTIFPERDEVEMMNEGEMKNEPEFYLTKDGVVKSLTV